MKHLIFPLLGFLAIHVSSVARAEPMPAGAGSTRPMMDVTQADDTDGLVGTSGRARGAHEHDGFYLRAGLGFGGLTDSLQSEAEFADGEHHQGTISGIASVGEFMLGGAVSPRLILGGGFWTATAFASVYTETNGDGIPSDMRQPDNFTLVGPFGDWYFKSRPRFDQMGGFHVQGSLGFAVLNGFRPEQLSQDDRRVAIGPGFMVGFGYEWWVADEWALGVLGRLTAAGLVERDERDDYWLHGVATFPAFLLTATYN